MTGACEFIVVISLMAAGGGASLSSECAPTYEACQQRISEVVTRHPTSSSIAQCVGAGGLVDWGRK